MTIGIYALYWEDQDLIYIGQSQNIERRKNWHINELKNNRHTNYKVQNAYNSYGMPVFSVLQLCKSAELNQLEIAYTEEFDSVRLGLNIIEPGTSTGYGYSCSSSKYSREEIVQIFIELANTLDTYKSIADKVNVPVPIVNSISLGNTHTWLQEEFPEQYTTMQENRLKRKSLNGSGTVYEKWGIKLEFVSPDGVHYLVENITGFCKTHPLLSNTYNAAQKGLNRLANGNAKGYKGWSICPVAGKTHHLD